MTDRPVLLLIHGWCCHPGFWQQQIPAFVAQGYRIVTPDLRQRAPQGDAIAAFAEDVVAACDGAEIVLIGHSMGGAVAVEAAIRLGARCRLVLGVDTFTDAAFYAARPAAEIAQRTQAFATDFAGRMTAMVGRIIAPPGAEPGLVPWVAGEMAAAEPQAALWSLRSLLAWDVGSRLPALPCPIETINSAWLDRSCAQVPGLERVRVHPMEGVGHFPMLEASARFNALALAILNRA